MPKITIAIGIALILLGLGFYFATEQFTAIIPAFFGLPVAVLGAVGMAGGDKARKHTAHAAVVITLLGAIMGLYMGGSGAAKAGEFTLAATEQLLLGVICAIHVVISVRSFIAARKARESQNPPR